MKKKIKQLLLSFNAFLILCHTYIVSADTVIDTEILLNWAENSFPQYFPSQQTTQSYNQWLFRFYPETNVYAGISTLNAGVYVYGGPWGNSSVTYIDSLSNLLSLAKGSHKFSDVIDIFVKGNIVTNLNFAIKSDGTVWEWGRSSSIEDLILTPVQNNNLLNIKDYSVASPGDLLLKHDGTVWKRSAADAFTQVSGLTDISFISTESGEYFAIKNDGTVWKWPISIDTPPTQVSGITNAGAIYFSFTSNVPIDEMRSFFVLKKDGTVWAWGNNQHGQLGDGTTNYRMSPTQIQGLNGIKSLHISPHVFLVDDNLVGGSYYAIKDDGTILAWGNNQYGQLGDGTTTNRSRPVQVLGLSNITKFTTSYATWCLALKSDGTVWGWGTNGNGQLGDGTFIDRTLPVQSLNITNVRDITINSFSSFALLEDGTVWAWGNDISGDLGNGVDNNLYNKIPIQVNNLSNIIKIVSGNGFFGFVLALRNDGTVWAWGDNHLGQLGDGTTSRHSTPIQVIEPLKY